MEAQFLIGTRRAGKTVFINNYIKNQKIENAFHFDFRKIFNEPYKNEKNQNSKIKELISTQNYDGSFFVELSIDNNHLNINGINILGSNADDKVFVHFFDKDWNFGEPSNIKNFIKHNFVAKDNNHSSDYDCNFDWNILFTKEYLNFKMKYNFNDFEEIGSSYRTVDGNGAIDFGYNMRRSIVDIITKVDNLPNISWIDGKRMEDKGRVIICDKDFGWGDQTHSTVTYFSIPYFFKFLNERREKL